MKWKKKVISVERASILHLDFTRDNRRSRETNMTKTHRASSLHNFHIPRSTASFLPRVPRFRRSPSFPCRFFFAALSFLILPSLAGFYTIDKNASMEFHSASFEGTQGCLTYRSRGVLEALDYIEEEDRLSSIPRGVKYAV